MAYLCKGILYSNENEQLLCTTADKNLANTVKEAMQNIMYISFLCCSTKLPHI